MALLRWHPARHSSDVGHRYSAGWVPGTGIQGGYQEGYTGVLPSCPQGATLTAQRAPEPPAGGGVGGQGGGCVRAPGTTTPGSCRPLRARFAVPGPLLGQTRLWANKGEIRVQTQ